jgi:NAD+ kinase
MPEKKLVGFAYNPLLPRAEELVASLIDSLDLHESYWVASAGDLQIGEETLASTSAVVTAGGDGTILRVTRVLAPYSVPILGINLGRVGFMTELSVEEAGSRIAWYLDGSPRVEERMMLQASVISGHAGEPHVVVHALNDVVLTRGDVARLLDIDTRIDGVLLTTYRADGLIVATPTGSTGYALAAGGPILHPETLETLIQPLAAHMSFQTGIVTSHESEIELRVVGGHQAVLSVDGVTGTTVEPGHVVVIRRSPYVARFLRKDPPAAFYSTLTQRLGVSGRQVRLAPGE